MKQRMHARLLVLVATLVPLISAAPLQTAFIKPPAVWPGGMLGQALSVSDEGTLVMGAPQQRTVLLYNGTRDVEDEGRLTWEMVGELPGDPELGVGTLH